MKARTRDNKGATTVALVLVLAFFVILPLGLLGFEISRFLLIEQMLRGASNAGALAGSAAMASSDMNQSYANREDWAMYIAGYTFEQNSILNISMSPTGTQGCTNANLYGSNTAFAGFNNQAADTGATPGPTVPQWWTPGYQQAAINVALVNVNNQMVNDTGNSANVATQIVVIAYYSDRASFASDLLPLGAFTAVSISRGGLPIIDMDLCFDLSASMDDESPVYFVNRCWNANKLRMQWSVVSGSGSTASNTIYGALGPNVTGSAVNIEPPQNLAAASVQPTGSVPNKTGNTWYPMFSELIFTGYTSPFCGLRSGYNCSSGSPVQNGNGYTALALPSPPAAYEQGLPPGNYNWKTPTADFGGMAAEKAPTTGVAPNCIFTDVVFDIPTAEAQGAPYTGPTWQGFNFKGTAGAWTNDPTGNVVELVEAARGNLENTAALNKAVGYWDPAGAVNPNLPAAGASQKPSVYGLSVQSGIYQAYWSYVVNNAQPMATARVAAYEFFQTMHISANSHFGLICFSDNEASSPFANPTELTNPWAQNPLYPPTYPALNYIYNVDGSYKLGNGGAIGGEAYAAGVFLVPGVDLDPLNDNWANNDVQQALLGSNAAANPVCTIVGNSVNDQNVSPQCASAGGPGQNPPCILATGNTDINGALTSAFTDVTKNARPTATNKAIVLFTDGVPDLPSYSAGPGSPANVTAGAIGGAGIPVYTIGLATNNTIQQYEDNVLSDGTNAFPGDGAADGIAWAAKTGNGSGKGAGQSEYFPALTNTLNTAFQAVARSLCVLQ